MISSKFESFSEKVSFKNQSVTAAGFDPLRCGAAKFHPSSELAQQKYYINPISDASHSTQDYFSPYAKSYNLLILRLDKIKSLTDNWNGYGAKAVDHSLIQKAKILIDQVKDLSPLIAIFPTARQSIQIEGNKNDIYCETEVFVDSVEIYTENNEVEQLHKQFQSIEQAAIAFRKAFNA